MGSHHAQLEGSAEQRAAGSVHAYDELHAL
jgi:hypothetical protein